MTNISNLAIAIIDSGKANLKISLVSKITFKYEKTNTHPQTNNGKFTQNKIRY